jgi:hypothetical protein
MKHQIDLSLLVGKAVEIVNNLNPGKNISTSRMRVYDICKQLKFRETKAAFIFFASLVEDRNFVNDFQASTDRMERENKQEYNLITNIVLEMRKEFYQKNVTYFQTSLFNCWKNGEPKENVIKVCNIAFSAGIWANSRTTHNFNGLTLKSIK